MKVHITNRGYTKFLIDPDPGLYRKDEYEKTLKLFRDLDPIVGEGGLGGGASGLMPEIQMALVLAGGISSILAVGFLQALGEDVYKQLKKGILGLVSLKPKRRALSLPPGYKGKIYSQLIWWIHVDDRVIIFLLNLDSKRSVMEALSSLPRSVDKSSKETKMKFVKLWWNGEDWENIQ